MSESQAEPVGDDGLTDKQRRFIEEYPKDCNKAAAARRAGYEPEYARQIGYENYTKPYIRAAIDARLKELAISGDEALKNVSDVATTRLNSYLKVVTKERSTLVPQHLSDAIGAAEAELDFEEQYTARAGQLLGLSGEDLEDHWAGFRAKKVKLQLQILRWQMELEQDPNAFRMVAGEPEPYEDIEVDLVSLAKADGEGRIKSLSFTEHGPKVEMYDALAANRDILKIDGRFVDKVEVKNTSEVDYSKLSKEALAEILNASNPE